MVPSYFVSANSFLDAIFMLNSGSSSVGYKKLYVFSYVWLPNSSGIGVPSPSPCPLGNCLLKCSIDSFSASPFSFKNLFCCFLDFLDISGLKINSFCCSCCSGDIFERRRSCNSSWYLDSLPSLPSIPSIPSLLPSESLVAISSDDRASIYGTSCSDDDDDGVGNDGGGTPEDEDGDEDGGDDGDGALDNSSCEISYPERVIILSCEGIRDAANPSSVPLSEICLLPSWLWLLLLIDGETCSLG